ncbi:MAG: hypothetical protein CL460_07990 [Acidimicrobiaceae bacterium]|nr:hypothetical protein [Acidimicrobiaceae bacterium]
MIEEIQNIPDKATRAPEIVAHAHQDESATGTDAPHRATAVRIINGGAPVLKNRKGTLGTKRVEHVGGA